MKRFNAIANQSTDAWWYCLTIADPTIQERIQFLSFAMILAAITYGFALKYGYYTFPYPPRKEKIVKLYEVVAIFLLFLISLFIIAPALTILFLSVASGHFINLEEFKLTASHQGWFNVAAITISGLILFFYYATRSKEFKESVWGKPAERLRNFGLGALTWIIAYPIVAVLDQLIELIGTWHFQFTHHEQVAVQFLKQVMDNPPLFLVMSLFIVVIVPFIEEFLFRGCLQNWLGPWVGRMQAIVLTSIIFALFHFSSSQGTGNIELLVSLFALSCFLGFLFERQRSLWAPIGLHMTFNALSVLAIFIEAN